MKQVFLKRVTRTLKKHKKAVIAISVAVLLLAGGGATAVVMANRPAAGVASFKVAAKGEKVNRNSAVELTLSAGDAAKRKFTVKSEPAAEFVADGQNSSTMRWKPAKPLTQDTTYKVKLIDQAGDKPEQLADTSFTVAAAPNVAAATDSKKLLGTDKVSVVFSEAMDPNATKLTFDLPGAGAWANPTTYEFTPAKAEPSTTYKYRVNSGSRAVGGGEFEADQEFAVATPGSVTAAISGVGGSNVGLQAPVVVSFDQPVDHAAAEVAFSLTPAAAGTMTWEGNSMTFHPSGYEAGLGYSAMVKPGVAATYGLPSDTAASASFTTQQPSARLNVPRYAQQYYLSCESSALRMVLAYKGIMQDDMAIVQRIGYAPSARDVGGNSWSDPNRGFVGEINGQQNKSGYGVHADPVAAAAISYGRGASVLYGVSATTIAQQIYTGDPVIVWGWRKYHELDAWNSPSGVVQAWRGEHTRVVVGVVGRADNPIGFYVTDPADGSQTYWAAGDLMANINVFGSVSNQAVVVR